MRKCECVDYTEPRKEVAELYMKVLTGKLSVREALVQFPKDCEDKTITAAWYALCHLEADEDLRAKDNLYRQEQDDYILYIAETFEKGEELPKNVIKEYTDFYEWAPSQFSNTKEGMWDKLKRNINI